MQYIYSFVCKACGAKFQEARKEPYKKVRTTKFCPDCKVSTRRIKIADPLKGEGCAERCGNCEHFATYQKRSSYPREWGDKANGWGTCAKLRYADEFMELVFKDDVCVEFEAKDGSDST